MKRKKLLEVDVDYLRRVQASTPEQRLDWLADAAEFVLEVKRGLFHEKK